MTARLTEIDLGAKARPWSQTPRRVPNSAGSALANGTYSARFQVTSPWPPASCGRSVVKEEHRTVRCDLGAHGPVAQSMSRRGRQEHTGIILHYDNVGRSGFVSDTHREAVVERINADSEPGVG
jgi:hypothetical protein